MTEEEVREIFAKNLKRLRKVRGLSQLKLANELQMAMTFLNDIENGKKWVSPATLSKLSTYFEVPVSDFFISESMQSKIDSKLLLKTLQDEINNVFIDVKNRFEFDKTVNEIFG